MPSNNSTQTVRIGFLEKLGFCTFSTASNVVFNFKDLFYLFFLTNVLGIRIAHAGIQRSHRQEYPGSRRCQRRRWNFDRW